MNKRFVPWLALGAVSLGVGLLAAGCGGGGSEPFTLAGRVKSESGAAIAGANVTATVSGQTQPVAATTTTSTGVFGLALPPATYVVEASASGFVKAQQMVTLTASQPILTMEFALSPVAPPPPPPANLGGRVTNASTLAVIPGATVTATPVGQVAPVETTTTGLDGRYGFGLAVGSYVIEATATHFQPQQRVVTLLLGDTNRVVDFALPPS